MSSSQLTKKGVCLVAGAGPGIGKSVAMKFINKGELSGINFPS